ncbi:hypothetical protein ACLOJK_035827 [Asimina triloba]
MLLTLNLVTGADPKVASLPAASLSGSGLVHLKARIALLSPTTFPSLLCRLCFFIFPPPLPPSPIAEIPMASLPNGGLAAKSSSSGAPGRLADVYSEVQNSRLNHVLPLPSVLKQPFKLVDGPASSAAGNPGNDLSLRRSEIKKLFPKVFGQPSVSLVPSDSFPAEVQKLKIGVVLSGGQAPGGHNVISGIFGIGFDRFSCWIGALDYSIRILVVGLYRAKGSVLYGFRGGPAGIMKGKYVELTSEFVYPYRNQGGFDMICSGRDKIETPEQFKQAEETVTKLDLDGLLVIGGDDSNTNACLLAENFRAKDMKTRVIGCPKTIDGDLKCKEVPASFGFDTACKIYAEMIGNVMTDARSTGKYYHFVRLMGRAASHITLECALQTHPNVTIIGEEVAAKKQTLKSVTDYITDVICKRADLGYNYGVVLIPEGLIDFIPEVQQLIAELNEILAHGGVDEAGTWKQKLQPQSKELFEFLPQTIQEQLLLERDPHGNVQVGNLAAPVEQWTVGGTALTSMMDVERRHGKFKPVIKKAMVELEGAPFKKFASMRDEWALKNRYISPEPSSLGHNLM